jgi:hypothetical protein
MKKLVAAALVAFAAMTLPPPAPAGPAEIQQAQSSQGRQIVAFGQWMGELQQTYRTATEALYKLDRAEILIDDYLYQDVSEQVMRREVRSALNESRALLDTTRSRLRDLPPLSQEVPEDFQRIAKASRDSVRGLIGTLEQHAELVAKLEQAALRGDIARYDALSARSMRLLSSMLEAENALLSLNLATLDGTTPQRGLLRSMRALNRAMIEMSDASAQMYAGTGTQESYLRSVRNIRPHIDDAREAIRSGRDDIAMLHELAERLTGEKARAARQIAETFRSSFRVETQLVRLVEDYATVLNDLGRNPDADSQSRVDRAVGIFTSELPSLSERRMSIKEKRRRLIVRAFQQ